MRILLAQNSLYYPSHGGGDKSNRLLMEALAARGHICRVVARLGSLDPAAEKRLLEQLAERGVEAIAQDSGVVVFQHRAVEVHVVASHPNLRAYFASQVAAMQPDVILTSTDDPAQLLLEVALKDGRARVVFLARTTLAVPFGPDCAFPSESKTAVLRAVDGVVGVSHYVAEYLRRWGGLEAVHVPISLLEPGPYPLLGRYENEFVTLVNPCAVKGINIFLTLADRMPEVAFAAVPTWGTTKSDLEALRRRPNVTLLEPVDNVDELFARTRVLLVPSVWAEARSRIIPEAMLRGVPVLAANVGGIPEAMLGVDYLLPVRPIAHYHHTVDEQMVPVAEVPEQDIGPWEAALREVLENPDRWRQLSTQARERALAYAASLSIEPFEYYLKEVLQKPKKQAVFTIAAGRPASPLETLSPEKRRLLALRLQKRTATGPKGPGEMFPAAAWREGARLRLFCFPYAGAGTAAYNKWPQQLPADIVVAPARLPGRESRLAEPPFRRMEPLVEALAEAIKPYLDKPFAFFGHSMGAVVAFELACTLRAMGLPLPAVLLVSGARAPRFRLNHAPAPAPSDEEFMRELERLEGIPREVLADRELLKVILPALKADAELYRNYVYREKEPLICPIRAYGGVADPNVRPEHLKAWAEHTTGPFAVRLFEGGHFFIETARAELLDAVASELAAIPTQPAAGK